MALFEGDIQLDRRRLTSAPLAKASGTGISAPVAGNKGAERWPGNVIYYSYIEPNIPNRQRIYNALQAWQANTHLVFIEGPPLGTPDYLEFWWSENSCSSPVGRQGGRNIIMVADWCHEVGLMHEIGHALGLYHEQTRPDRDSYININWDNMPGVPCHPQYWNQTFGPAFVWKNFDFSSIMLYDSYMCAINPNIPVMTRKDGSTWTGATYPSSLDFATVKLMYPKYEPFTPYAVRDIGVGAGSTMTTYAVTNTPASGGNYTLSKYNPQSSSWETVSGSGVRIDVDNSGFPWVVKADGRVYRWSGSAWYTVGSLTGAKDIGFGSSGTVYALSSATMNGNEYSAYIWTGTSWGRIPTGGGRRITVDNIGRPWVTTSDRKLKRWNGSQWETISQYADYVGIGSDGAVYTSYDGVLRRKSGSATQLNGDKDNTFYVVNSFSPRGYNDPSDPAFVTEVEGGALDRFWIIEPDDPSGPGLERGIAARGTGR